MLQRRLTITITAVAALIGPVALAGCGSTPLDDPLVKPGISAIDRSAELACDADAAAVRTAIDTYTMLEGSAPADEAALVPDFLREESTYWDVADGELVAQNPACGEVGTPAPTPTEVQIVTQEVPADTDLADLTPEAFLAAMTPDEVDAVGGLACAQELARVYAAGARYLAEQGTVPTSVDDLVTAGLLDAPPERWTIDGTDLLAVDGSGCEAPDPVADN